MKTEKKKTKVDLVTGFLGAGKTTFIKKYARYLLDKGCKIGVLENDFGAVNVDMLLLQELEDTLKHLEAVQKKFHCHRMTKPEIIMKDWSELTDEDMERIANSGYEPDSHEKLWFDQDKAYTSLYFMNMKLPDNAMEDAVSRLMSDSKCGKIFRVKGFMQNAEGKWLELNATHKNITVKPIERGQAVFIVIGEGLDKEHIDGYFVPV